MPKISVCIPTHDMTNGEYFLKRLKHSLFEQTYQDFEVIITKEGAMAENTNAAIKQAKGDIIKILYMDDYLWSKDALRHLVDNFTGGWYASGCVHTTDGQYFERPHFPSWSTEVPTGVNTIGSPSVIAFANDNPLLFDENLSWLLDVELYGRLYERYGEPYIQDTLDVAMGIGPHQMTNILTDEQKLAEHHYIHGTTN